MATDQQEQSISHPPQKAPIDASLNLLSLIGNTPLMHLPLKIPQSLFVKLEYFNPGGSIKDRTAAYMIEQAEKKGILKPGGTIVEASSGNQGIALAMIGALKGYRVIITIPYRTSSEKKQTLIAYGAEVISCDENKNEDYRQVAIKLAQEIDGAFMPDQYFNHDNSEAHYLSTGPEIWNQTNGSVTHVVIAAGSCGTISGAGRFLKEQNPDIKIIGVDAATSPFSCKNPRPYLTEGLGIDYVNGIFNKQVVDKIYPVTDTEAFAVARKTSKERGLLIGPSSGAVLHVVEKIAPTLPSDAIIVAVLADSGRAYLSKLFSI